MMRESPELILLRKWSYWNSISEFDFGVCFSLNSEALNNEFFAKACVEWCERLGEGW